MSKSRRRPRSSGWLYIICPAVTLLAALLIFLALRGMILPPEEIPPAVTDPTPATAVPTTLPPDTTDEPAVTTAPNETTEPTQTEPSAPVIILPEAEAVDKTYFSSVIFVGDSRTQGMQIATGGYGATFYADRGIAVDGLEKRAFIKRTAEDGTARELTVAEALTEDAFDGMLYLWFGLNEVGWISSAHFENTYRQTLTKLTEICPDADICLMSVPPVGRSAIVIGADSPAAANERIKIHNEIIYRLAEEFGLYYLDCTTPFTDEEGYLPEGYSNDGIHLRVERNRELLTYIQTHPIPGRVPETAS